MLDALGLEQVILGGVSLGGWIAAEFAVRWPERVKKLWIADAPGLWVEDVPLGDLFRIMQDKDKVRKCSFTTQRAPSPRMVIRDNVDEQTMMQVYQNMTVLARLVWETPLRPQIGDSVCIASSARHCCSGAPMTSWCRRPTAKPTRSTSKARN